MIVPPMSLRIVLVPDTGTQIEPPAEWLEAARAGLALRADLDRLAERVVTLEAGRNVVVTTDPARPGVLRIEAISSAATYETVAHSRDLTSADNGKVLEVTGDNVVLGVPATLPRGFCALVRQVGASPVTVQPGSDVTFVPLSANAQTMAQWDEIAIEVRREGQALVRTIA